MRRRLGDDALVAGAVAGPMTTSAQLYGIENALYLAIDDPPRLAAALDFATRLAIAYGLAQLDAGAHAVIVFEPAALEVPFRTANPDLLAMLLPGLVAILLMPLVLRSWGPAWAFGIPGILMFIATFVFWLGRNKYVNVPPSRGNDPDAFINIVRSALMGKGFGPGTLVAAVGMVGAAAMLLLWALKFAGVTIWPEAWGFVITACLALGAIIAGVGFGASLQLERARGLHPDAAIEGVRSVLRILIVFALVTPFWSLFDQKASTWVIQGKAMVIPHDLWWWPSWLVKDATQMQALNPLMVMLLIPFNNLVLYPALRKMGFNVTALRRMGWGIAISALSWIVAGVLQLQMDEGQQVSLAWQTLPYLLLTFGEVLVSATALEFAYSQAPMAMKGVIMAFWYLTSTFGGLWVLLTNASVRDPAVIGWIQAQGWTENAFLMFFFAGFAFVAALAFALYARTYPMQDNYRTAA